MKKIPPIHPGEILKEEFMIPYGITASKLSEAIHVSPIRISQLIRGKRSLTVDTAFRLSRFFGSSPEFWIGLQTRYDLEMAKDTIKKIISHIKPLKVA